MENKHTIMILITILRICLASILAASLGLMGTIMVCFMLAKTKQDRQEKTCKHD